MKVLLLYPEFPDTFWSFKHALKFIRKKASTPPLGLLTVAAMLPTHWEKRLVDLNVRPLRQRAGEALVRGKGMPAHARRGLGCPQEAAAEDLGLDLQVEDHGLAVRGVEAVGLQQGQGE